MSGLEVRLKNAVYMELFSLSCEGVKMPGVPVGQLKEPVEHIRMAQENWERRLKVAINKLCCDYNTMLEKQVKGSEAGQLFRGVK